MIEDSYNWGAPPTKRLRRRSATSKKTSTRPPTSPHPDRVGAARSAAPLLFRLGPAQGSSELNPWSPGSRRAHLWWTRIAKDRSCEPQDKEPLLLPCDQTYRTGELTHPRIKARSKVQRFSVRGSEQMGNMQQRNQELTSRPDRLSVDWAT